MNYPHRPGGSAARQRSNVTQPAPWTARRTQSVTPQPQRPLRRFEALALDTAGEIVEVTQRAPSHPVFEGAFTALARGTILATEEGPVAIEDLLPGTRIETRDDGFQPVCWIGMTTLVPNVPLAHMPARLFRVPVDSFGPSRPMPDLMLAPHARLLHRSAKLRGKMQEDAALAPVTAFEDGFTVIRVAPVSPVNVYHLAFQDHQILRANGVEIESFHPGPEISHQVGQESLKLFMSFFPHLRSVSDFGPTIAPRLTEDEVETLLIG